MQTLPISKVKDKLNEFVDAVALSGTANAQFTIKRRALMLIKKAFAENGIKIAVPTVHVEGGSEAAAAQQAIKMTQPVANQA